jgi:tetratricopeptide (TPR) repeat protein
MLRIIEVVREVLPIDDPVLVKPLLVLMSTAEHEGRFALQADAALEVVRIIEKHHGLSDRRTLACLNSASTALIFGGESGRAVGVIRRSIAIHESIPPAARDPLMLANSRRVYAWSLALSGDIDNAIPAYHAASDALGRILPPDHYVVALADAGLAYCLAERARIDDAESLSARALDHISRTGTPSPDQYAHICFCRAHVLCAQARFAEALPLLEAAWDAFYGQLIDMEWSPVAVRDAIAAAAAMGDTQREAVWRARQLPIPERAATSSIAE